jgi:flagellar biogenesis protein FliO
MVFDYLENRAVAVMLLAGADGLTPEMVAQASRFSQLKAIFSTLSLGLLLILILAWAFRRWRTRAR